MNMVKLESEVLALPVDARAQLAHRLLLSLDETDADIPDAEFSRLWGEECVRRLADPRPDIGGEIVLRKAKTLPI
jgi:hypothetical protein